jgi:U6 snRNA-associated Sm-like protein LSm6
MSDHQNGTTTSHPASQENHSAEQDEAEQPGAPSVFLQKIIGQRVLVRLNSGIDYSGILSCLDGYMNIAMEDTIELVNGVEKGKFGDAFIRGNNGTFILLCTFT